MNTPFVHLHLHSHYSILDGMGILAKGLLIIFILFFHGCTKDDKVDTTLLSEKIKVVDKHSGSNGIYTLPINLSRYNRHNVSTKSNPADTSYYFCLDSLIDQNNPRQVYFEKSGWNYCQIPFKYNEKGVLAAVGAKPENIKDSLVSIKSFFLQVNNIVSGEGSEYIVTLLPTKHYSTINPSYDFLDKPSFSGVILYSDLSGHLLRTEYLHNGEIRQCSLFSHSEVETKLPKTKSTIYVCSRCGCQTLETDGICIACKELELNSIVILADGTNWDNYISMCLYNLAQELGYIAPDLGGGGGGSSSGGGGNIEDTDTKVSVVCRGTGCFNALLTIGFYTKGSFFSYSAPLRGSVNSCWFKEWTYDNITSNHISVTQQIIRINSVQENQTLNATYSTNSICDTIAVLMQDGKLKTVIDTLVHMISVQNKFFSNSAKELYAVLYNDFRGYQTGIGTKYNTRVPLASSPQTGVVAHQLVHHSHYHTSRNVGPSIKDLASLCMFFLYDCANVNTSTFSILTNNDIIVIRMKNIQTFLSFINKYLIDSNINDWHQKQTDVLIGRFSNKFGNLYKNSSQQHEIICVAKELLTSMGLELFWGTHNNDQTTGIIDIQWNNTDFLDITPIPLGCISN